MERINFGLIGASGYIAPRHVIAMKELNHNLKLITDPHDNVGFIDKYFPESKYFKEIERFDRSLAKAQMSNNKIDFISVCSPNYLHDSHIRLALRNECNCICEKPLVIKDTHLDNLYELEKKYNKKIYTILQLRHHPDIIKLKNKIKNSTLQNHKVNLKYITPRGQWYNYSWKGDFDKSGGVMFNIGIHFFDMLIWIFGKPLESKIHINEKNLAKGLIKLQNAEINFMLSVNSKDLPHQDWRPYRSITVNDEEIEFSNGFTDLHTEAYKAILNGKGYGISDIDPAIRLVSNLVYSNS